MKKNLLYLFILIALVCIAYFISQKDTKQTNLSGDTIYYDFAIEDIDQVEKVFIGNNVNQKSILVEKVEDDVWVLENGERAQKDRIETMLSTFERAELLQIIPKSKLKSVSSKMAANNKKIMIFGANDQLLKTWYLSHATQNQQGTYALLELPDKGKSSLPAVITLQGFRGYLGSRFGTDILEWKSTEVWHFPDLDFKKISVFRPKNVHDSFEIEIEDFVNRKFTLKNNDGAELNFNPEKLAQYVAGFKSLYLESFRTNMSDTAIDSIRNATPDYVLEVTGIDGAPFSMEFYHRPPTKDHVEAGYLLDPERMAGFFNDELVSFQTFHMGKMLAVTKEFN
ncbi:MAG: hypothetical protein AAF487_12960 [Bacteroidota bacterium]